MLMRCTFHQLIKVIFRNYSYVFFLSKVLGRLLILHRFSFLPPPPPNVAQNVNVCARMIVLLPDPNIE